jgi:integrase
VSDATCNRRLEALRRAYRLGATTTPPKVLYVPTFPPKLPEDNVREGFLSDEILAALLSHIRVRDPVLGDFLEWFSWTGMRPGAIRDLGWTAIDRTTWTLRLVRGRRANKGKPRYLPLIGPLRAIIERAWARRVAAGEVVPWVFWRRYDGHPRPGLVAGDPVRIIDYRKAWASACQAVGCRQLVPYDLRRTAVRNLKRAGVDDVTIMAITAHKTRSMLERYQIVDTPAIADAFVRTFARVTADVRRISPGDSQHRLTSKLSTGAKNRRL